MKKVLFIVSVFLISCNNQKNHQEMEMKAWAQPAPKGGNTSAYFTIQNNSPSVDTLLTIESEQAEMAQIHESYQTDDGLTGMREVQDVILQPDQIIQFKRGEKHLMLMNTKEELQPGDSLIIKLGWAKRGKKIHKIPVKNATSEIIHGH